MRGRKPPYDVIAAGARTGAVLVSRHRLKRLSLSGIACTPRQCSRGCAVCRFGHSLRARKGRVSDAAAPTLSANAVSKRVLTSQPQLLRPNSGSACAKPSRKVLRATRVVIPNAYRDLALILPDTVCRTRNYCARRAESARRPVERREKQRTCEIDRPPAGQGGETRWRTSAGQ